MLLQTCLETWAQAQLKRAEGVRLPENQDAATRCMLRPVPYITPLRPPSPISFNDLTKFEKQRCLWGSLTLVPRFGDQSLSTSTPPIDSKG